MAETFQKKKEKKMVNFRLKSSTVNKMDKEILFRRGKSFDEDIY